MGLGVTVGLLADLVENDPEGADWERANLKAVKALMTDAGLTPHAEPQDCNVWWADGYGYTGLHALREVAGLLWKGLPIPRTQLLTGNESPNSDKLFQATLSFLAGKGKRSLWQRLAGREDEKVMPPFSHLVYHSDAEGYYVPTDFVLPLTPLVFDEDTAQLWPLGSVQRLSEELVVLAKALEIPDDLISTDDKVFDVLDDSGAKPDGALWEAQPTATYSALILREACVASLATGAAIAFG